MKLELRFEEVFADSIEAVWRALTDPRLLARWLMDNDFEPRIGHMFTLHEPPTSEWRGRVECEVLELEPPRRMVWSWNGGMDGEVTTQVIFDLRPEQSGTRLVFRHEGDATPAQSDAVRSGWTRKLATLRQVLGPDYARRVAIATPRAQVFDAIATLEGLRGWWTTIVDGSASTGGELRFGFDGMDEHITMRVVDATGPSAVEWRCVEHTSAPRWNDTIVRFDLDERGAASCELGFEHRGLPGELVDTGWERFLASLVAYAERGAGAPFGA